MGVITSLSILIRLPNLLLILMIPLGLFVSKFLQLHTITNKKIITLTTTYYISVIISSTFIYLIMVYYDIAQVYLDNLFNPKTVFKVSGLEYSITRVIKVYMLDFFYFLLYLITTSILFFSVEYLKLKIRFRKQWILYIGLGLGLVLLSIYPFTFNYNNSIKYVVPSLVLIILYKSSLSKLSQWILILSFLFILVQVAGSNTGIFLKSSFLFILIIPIALGNLSHATQSNIRKLSISLGVYIGLYSLFLYFVFIYGVGQNPLIRLKATYPVHVNNYNGMYTTQDRAQEIELTTLDLMRFKVDDSTELFIYGHKPLFYYLTQMKPADKEIWLIGNSLAKPASIFDRINLKDRKPIFMDTKQGLFSTEIENAKNLFLNQNHYRLVKSTRFYDIWVAN
ncbi:hypothetical protein GO491_10835 [Flavobacteriaceae bacterium Ap0902]|nr:hypothetical protein [Flavobacteriaceae bacterium Ap0902]